MNKATRKLIGVTVAAMVLVIIFAPAAWGWYIKTRIYIPYQQFRAEEEKAMPLFDALNNQVYAEILIPPGVEEIGKHQGGLTGAYHGRYLRLDYRIVSSTDMQIRKFYEQFLTANGWEKYKGLTSSNTERYFRGTGCIDIHLFDTEYDVMIEHDYFKQDFSPKKLPLNAINLSEFGESNFANCPPDPGAYP